MFRETETDVERFKRITSYDIANYYSLYVDFVNNYLVNINNFYSGNLNELPSESFDKLDYLDSQRRVISEAIVVNRDNFNTFEDWELVDEIESVLVNVLSFTNLDKYLRSDDSLNRFSFDPKSTYTLKPFETLENVSKRVIGDVDFDNDYVQIAIDNNLAEDDFSIQDGTRVIIPNKSTLQTSIFSVVGSLNGENMYGVDLDKKLTFENDDLKTLSNNDTMLQTIDVLLNLHRNNNPEFPDVGYDKSLVLGQSRSAINFILPVFLNPVKNTFTNDDTIASFEIKDINIENNFLYLDVEIQTALGQSISENVSFSLS